MTFGPTRRQDSYVMQRAKRFAARIFAPGEARDFGRPSEELGGTQPAEMNERISIIQRARRRTFNMFRGIR